MVFDNVPPALTKYLHINLERTTVTRLTRKPSMKDPYINKKSKDGFFYRSIFIYNTLREEIRVKPRKIFNKEIKKYIFKNFSKNDVPRI